MKIVKAVGVILAVAAGAYLIGVNALRPYSGVRLAPASELDLGIAIVLMVAATGVCIWRLIEGAEPGSELERFLGAAGGQDDLG